MSSRTPLGLASVLALVASATLSFADVTPAAAPAPSPGTKLSSLPEVVLPSDKTIVLRIPKQIPKTEKVDGFFIREPQYIRDAKKAKAKPRGRKMRAEEMAYAQVTESEAAMDAIENTPNPTVATCFTVSVTICGADLSPAGSTATTRSATGPSVGGSRNFSAKSASSQFAPRASPSARPSISRRYLLFEQRPTNAIAALS